MTHKLLTHQAQFSSCIQNHSRRDDFLSIRVGFDLEPVKKPLLFHGGIVDSEEQLSKFCNFKAIRNHWFISWGHLCSLLYNNSVCILIIRFEFSTITNLPAYDTQLPDNNAFLQITHINTSIR